MNNEEMYSKVLEVINKDIRPFIEADGGRINLKSVENGSVFVSLSGACAGCPGAAMTLRGGVERILKTKLPEVTSVRLA